MLGTLVTSFKSGYKVSLGLAAPKQKRNALQVLANAGTAAILALFMLYNGAHSKLYALMIAAVFAAAAADTTSSELGNVYGKRFINILTLKKDVRGLDGVISLEGTLLGLAGSAVVALIYCLFTGWHSTVLIIVVAGTAGNLFDSFLGAALERKHYLNNNAVNFLNTVFAALIAWMLYVIF